MRTRLLEALRDIGQAYHQANDRARAEACRKDNLAMARDLLKQYPGNEDAKILLANSLFDTPLPRTSNPRDTAGGFTHL
jgi:hypothetical protein